MLSLADRVCLVGWSLVAAVGMNSVHSSACNDLKVVSSSWGPRRVEPNRGGFVDAGSCDGHASSLVERVRGTLPASRRLVRERGGWKGKGMQAANGYCKAACLTKAAGNADVCGWKRAGDGIGKGRGGACAHRHEADD